jgi:hypothetical protein
LSYRDFLTAGCLALFTIALTAILAYYSMDDWVNANMTLLTITFALIVMAFNHVFYRLEHKRSNNFVGRMLHDAMFLLFAFVILRLKQLLSGSSLVITSEHIAGILVSVLLLFIFLLAYELVIAILKRILAYFRWQIL